MRKLIDADALEKKLLDAIDIGRRTDCDTSELEAVLVDVRGTPEAVVRCKDCLLFHPHAIEEARFGDCDAWDTKTAKHGFCFLGKRKANE